MKNHLTMVFVAMALVTTMSCQDQKKTDRNTEIIEEVSEIGLPNASDIHFDESITALESNDHSNAAMHLKKGVEELKNEGEDLTGKSKEILRKSMDRLNQIAKSLESDKKIEVSSLREAIANAELAVRHDYLISDGFYIFSEPEKTDDHIPQKEFRRNMGVLEKTTIEMDAKKSMDKDGSGQKLYDEGKNLEEQLKTLMNRIKDHNKRSNEHIKTHHPEHYLPMGYPYM